MMSGIRGRDTKPEIALRSGLHRLGFRFTLRSQLPGKPDVVLPKWRTVVFFHGCFWHGHEGCPLFRLPATRTEFWQDKISGNRLRDGRVALQLQDAEWRVATVRECAVRGPGRSDWPAVCEQLGFWIIGKETLTLEISADDGV